MKTKLPLILCLLFFAGAVKAQSPAPIGGGRVMWPRYTVKGEEFSVALPHVPSMVSRKAPLPGTNKQRTERVLQSSAGGIEYSIYIYENPKPRLSLDDFIREQTANGTREVERERILSVDGRVGKEHRYRVNDKPTIEQFFFAEKRLYRFVVNGAPADHAGVQQFFSSVSFDNKRRGFAVSDGPGDAPRAGEKFYTGREVDTKARLISKPEPIYTEAARQNEIEGTVILKVVLSGTGSVISIRVTQGLPHGLTERCVEAAKKIKFVPAIKDGKPVSMWVQLEYNFNLH